MKVHHRVTGPERRRRLLQAEQFDVYEQLDAIWRVLDALVAGRPTGQEDLDAIKKARRISQKVNRKEEV